MDCVLFKNVYIYPSLYRNCTLAVILANSKIYAIILRISPEIRGSRNKNDRITSTNITVLKCNKIFGRNKIILYPQAQGQLSGVNFKTSLQEASINVLQNEMLLSYFFAGKGCAYFKLASLRYIIWCDCCLLQHGFSQ